MEMQVFTSYSTNGPYNGTTPLKELDNMLIIKVIVLELGEEMLKTHSLTGFHFKGGITLDTDNPN